MAIAWVLIGPCVSSRVVKSEVGMVEPMSTHLVKGVTISITS